MKIFIRINILLVHVLVKSTLFCFLTLILTLNNILGATFIELKKAVCYSYNHEHATYF